MELQDLIKLQNAKIVSGEISSTGDLVTFLTQQSMTVDVANPNSKVLLLYSGNLIDGTKSGDLAVSIASTHSNVAVIDKAVSAQLANSKSFEDTLDSFIEQDFINNGQAVTPDAIDAKRSEIMFGITDPDTNIRTQDGVWDMLSRNFLDDNQGDVRVILGDNVNSTGVFTQTELFHIINDASRPGINGVDRVDLKAAYDLAISNGSSEADALNQIRDLVEFKSQNDMGNIEFAVDSEGKLIVGTHENFWKGTDIENQVLPDGVSNKTTGFELLVDNLESDPGGFIRLKAGVKALDGLGVVADVATMGIAFYQAKQAYEDGDIEGAKMIVGTWASEAAGGWAGGLAAAGAAARLVAISPFTKNPWGAAAGGLFIIGAGIYGSIKGGEAAKDLLFSMVEEAVIEDKKVKVTVEKYEYTVPLDQESEEVYGPQVAVVEKTGVTDGSIEEALENFPIPELKPKDLTHTDADGNTKEYSVHEEIETQGMSGYEDDIVSHDKAPIGIDHTDGTKSKVVDKSSNTTFSDGTVVNSTSFFSMVEKGVGGFAEFMGEVVAGTVLEVNNQSSVLVAQVIAGIIAGRDIEDITEEIAVQAVAMGAVEATLSALGDISKNSDGSITIGNDFGSLLEDKALATEAIKGALTSVAVTAILSGRDAGFEDYVTVATSASVSRIINYGITNSGYSLLTHKVGEQVVKEVVNGTLQETTKAVYAPTPPGAGLIAAATVVTSSLISGNGVNVDTMRAAAVAGGTAYAGAALVGTSTSAGLLGVKFGAFAGPAGIIIGAALGVLIGNLFKSGGEKVYHNETIGSVVQTLDDGTEVLVGVRETGALLQASDDIVDLVGTDGDDVLTGNSQKNTLVANGGDDMLEGRASDDALLAGAGNDYVEAGDGNDYIEGNDGNDYIRGDDGDDIILAGAGKDLLSGGKGNDQIEGEGGDDYIYGDSGDDIILGGAGNDAIHGGAGNDVLSGGVGDDVLDGSIGSDEIHGDAGGDVLFGDDGDDTLHGDGGNDIVYGDDGVDILHGDLGDDILDGGADSDLLYGGLGKDILFGQDGRDHLYGEIGDDYMVGGRGNDKLDGGAGDDVYVFGLGDGQDTITDSEGTTDIIRLANYTIDEITFLYDGDDVVISAAPDGSDKVTIQDQLTDNSIEYLMFSDGYTIDLTSLVFDADNVVSYNATNVVTENMIDQTTFTGTWQEVEEDRSYMGYNPYSNWYINNYDTSVISNEVDMELYNDVQVKALKVKNRTWYGRTTVTIHYSDFIELSLMGTQGSDRIVGFNVGETIESYGGDDQVYGNSGSDTIDSGRDHDIVYGGSQDDTINAGSYSDKAYGGMGNDTINGEQGNDSLYGQWGADIIHGNADDDFISGGFDNDTLYGDAGNDIIYGDAGDDYIYGNTGNDYVIGGFGNDNVQGDEGNDYVEGGAGGDTLRGGSGDDVLRGEDGVDYLYGDAGDDLLIGGKGGDTINGGSGNDTASYAESDAGVDVNLSSSAASKGYAQGDTISNIENVIGSDYSDTITGDASANILEGGYGNDTLSGGGGDDVLQGGAGADVLDGGSGWDKVSYADSISGVEIDFVAGTGKYGHAEGDSFSNMEHIVGSKYDDRFVVGNSAATFEAGDGYDTVVMSGNAADYTIVLDGSILKVTRKSDSELFTFPDAERLQFDDISYGHGDFPGEGDAVASITENNSGNGILVRDTSSVTITNEKNVENGYLTTNFVDGTYEYIPYIDYIGVDSFAIRIEDPATGLIRIQNVDIDIRRPEDQVMVNTTISRGQYYPRTALLENGNYVVVWQDNVNDPNNIGVKAQILDSFGNKVGSEISVVSNVSSTRFNLSKLNDGGFVVTWSEGSDVSLRIFNENGSSRGSKSSVATNADYSGVTELDNGNFAVVWSNRGYPANSYVKIYNSSGSPQTGDLELVPEDYNFRISDISTLSDGTVVAVDYNGILQRINTVGNKEGDFIFISTNISGSQNASSHKITALENGSYIITWYELMPLSTGYNKYSLYVQVMNNDGTIKKEASLVYEHLYGGSDPAITSFSDGRFSIAWKLPSGVILQNYDVDANKIGDLQFIKMLSSVNNVSLSTVNDNDLVLSYGTFSVNSDSKYSYNIITKLLRDGEVNPLNTEGNDVSENGVMFVGSKGADTLSNYEVGDYSNSDDGINIDFSNSNSTDFAVATGGLADGDRLYNVRDIIGSDFDDVITGDGGANSIYGNAGDDVLSGAQGIDKLYGGEGDDVLMGGSSNDTLYGGEGDDIAVFSGVTSGYLISKNHEGNMKVRDIDVDDGSDHIDILHDIESLRFSNGTFTLADLPQNQDSIMRITKNQTVIGILGDPTVDTFALHEDDHYEGDVVINSDGTYQYTPVADFIGLDSFYYIITNQDGINKRVDVKIEISESGESRLSSYSDENEQTSVAVLADQGYVVTWSARDQDGSGTGIFGQIFNADNTKRTGEFLVNSHTENYQKWSKTVALKNGGFVTTWSGDGQDGDRYGVYAQLFDEQGETISEEIQVNTITSGYQHKSDITVLSDGHFVISWQSGSDLAFQIFDSSGVGIGEEILIDAPHSEGGRSSVVALHNGNFMVAWSASDNGQDIFVQQYTSNGLKSGEEIRLNQIVSGDQVASELTVLEDGAVAAIWYSTSLKGIILNTDGSVRGSEFQVNPTTDSDYRGGGHAITNLSDGNFAVIWIDYAATTEVIRGQIFDANGGKIVGGSFVVSDDAGFFNLRDISISSDANGEFVVTWSGRSIGSPISSPVDIYIRKFGNDGIAVLDTFKISEDSYYIPSKDNIEGTAGNDVIQTGADDDVIDAGLGSDVVGTGAGTDTIIMTLKPGATDVIIDFDVSNDVIDLVAYDFLFNGFADLQLSMSQSGADTVIDFSNGHSLTLQNIVKENLTAANFIGKAASNSVPVATVWKADIDISDGTVNIDVLAGASDLDLDALTLDDITDPANGTAVITNGKIDYTPNADFTGYDYLDYTISDDKGGVVTKTLTLNVEQINDAPVVLNALSKQSIAEDSEFSYTIPGDTFNDVDGDNLNYTAALVDGSVLPVWLGFDGITFTGIPENDDVGSVFVRVTAQDQYNETVYSDFELEVTNTNDAPTVRTPLVQQYIDEDSAFSLTITDEIFNDVDGDNLTYTATLTDGGAIPPWLSFDGTIFTGTPENDDVGIISLRVIATDPSGESVYSDFVLEVINTNDAPTVDTSFVKQYVDEDSAFSLTITDHVFNDVDGDNLTYTVTQTDGTAIPPWLSFDGTTFTGTPRNADVGIISVRVTASDPYGSTVYSDFDIEIVNTNDDPTLSNALMKQYVNEDSAFSYTIPEATFDDIDNDTHTYTVTLTDGGDIPPWLSFDGTTFTGTPKNDDVGVVSLRVTATDPSGASVYSDFELEVINTNDDPTLLIALTKQSIVEDSEFIYTIPDGTFNDVDGDSIAYTAALTDGGDIPPWLSFDGSTYTGVPLNDDVGIISLRVTASDPYGKTVYSDFELEVINSNDKPIVVFDLTKQTAEEDSEFNFTIPANTFDDIDGDVLTYTATLADGGAIPPWLSFDGTTFSGTPADDDVGVIVVRVTAWDSGNETVFSDFELEVASAAIEPAVPTEPSEPAEPSEPTEPSEPVEPSEPIEPVVSTEPTTPSVPTVHDTVNPSGVTEGSDSPETFVVPDTDYTIIGKGGGDVFEFSDAGDVTTSILEFDHTTDVLDISAFDDLRSFDDLTITEGSAIVHLGNGQNIHIDGITPDDLTADNFSFVESVAGSTIHGVHSESDHIRGTEGDDVLHYNADDIWDNGFYTVNMGSPDEIVEDGEMVYIRPRYKTYDVYDGGAGYDVVKLTEHGDALFLFDANGSTPLGAGSDHARVIDVEEIHAGAGDDIVDLTSFDFSHEGVKIKGGDGKDHLWGNSGDDTLYGDDGDDNLDGSAGDDDLFGGDGDDKLHGRSGDDHLHGGLGADYILTGLGEDSIDYSLLEESTSASRDVIADFDVDNDTLNFEQLVNQGIVGLDDLTVSHEGDSTIVSADDNDFEVELLGVFAKDDIDFEFG